MTEPTDGGANNKLHYGRTGIDQLYARVWGDSIQFGFYETPEIDLEAAVIQTKRQMLQAAKMSKDDHVLEVASGWGATSRYLARAVGARVTATNIEHDHLEAGQALSDLAGVSSLISHKIADFHKLPFPDQAFDVWWSQEATVHATNKTRLFSEAYRVLKPRGRIIFSDQTTNTEFCSNDDIDRISARHGSQDVFSADDFAKELKQTGFGDVEVLDWSSHMQRHFAKLVARMELNYERLVADISKDVVDFNLSMWRFGRDLSAKGGMGWCCFTATKSA